jgi:YHS domain-containing protein
MSDVNKLVERIDGAIAAAREQVRQHQQPLLQDSAARQLRLARFEEARDQVRAIARPRLEALVKRFGDKVQATPRVSQTRAAATLEFKSPQAFITLTFSVVPDEAVRNVVVEYDLDVAPVLMVYESHGEFRAPIEAVNPQALEAWLDDQIVKFVDFYVRLHESEVYNRSDYVEDPVAHVKFPKFAASGTLEHGGKTYYFIDERTRQDFAREKHIGIS